MTMWNRLRLRSRDPKVRSAAIQKLQSSLNEGVIESLGDYLADDDPNVRTEAALALGTGKNDRALQILLEALCDGRPETRLAAAQGLGAFGGSRTYAALTSSLNDPAPAVRAAAAKALCQMKWRPATPEQQSALDFALGKPAHTQPIGPVSETGRRPRPARRSTEAGLELLMDDRNSAGRFVALRDPNPLARIAAIHGLGKEAQTAEIALQLHSAVRDPDHRVRLAAAQALSNFSDSAFTPTFLSLCKDSNFEVRLAAVHFLRRTQDRQHVPVLVTMLSDRDNDVRQAAAEALSDLGCPSAIEGLVLALSDEEKAVRQAAELALSRTDLNWMQSEAARRAGKRLEELLDSRPSWVRAAMGHVVSKLQQPDNAIGAAA